MRKLIALVLAFCVLFAPMLSTSIAAMALPVANVQDQQQDCHMASSHYHEHKDSVHHSDKKISHGCCFSLVGVLPDLTLTQAAPVSDRPIPFNPSMSLASRIEGLYRPPR